MDRLRRFYNDQTSCASKAVRTAVSGYFLGWGFSTFIGTFEGAHGMLPGDTLAAQLKYGLRTMVTKTWERGVRSSWNFAVVGGLFSAIECAMEKTRGKHDMLNGVSAGLVAGAVFGALAKRGQGSKTILKSCIKSAAGFACFVVAIDFVIHGLQERAEERQKKLADTFQEKKKPEYKF